MSLADELSHRGIPYGIRQDGSLFVLAGDRTIEASEYMRASDIAEIRAELIAGRDAKWDRLGNWASYAASALQERKRQVRS